MTLYGASDPQVCGQPMSPFFGQQQNVRYAGPPVIPSPNASPNSGPQVTALASVSNGSMPMNANVTAVNGVNTAAPGGIGTDNASVAEMLGSGNGVPACCGVAIGNTNGNPATNGAINSEKFVGGIVTAGAAIANGPTTIDNGSLTQVPMSGATIASNVANSGFQG
jgi:hypothetical protein